MGDYTGMMYNGWDADAQRVRSSRKAVLLPCPYVFCGAIHTHTAILDENGNGVSSTTNGHTHEVKKFNTVKNAGHSHPVGGM